MPETTMLILQRQGCGATIRTSDKCPLWGTGYHVEITDCGQPKNPGPGWKPFRAAITTPSRSITLACRSEDEARRETAARISAELGKPVEFEPWIEAYCPGCEKPGEKWIVHCLYEPGTETIRLHRSNVCLVTFEHGIPAIYRGDSANAAYVPLIAAAVCCYIGQGKRAGNTREWLAWLISEYISSNAMNRFPHSEPKLSGAPVFPHDLIPSVLDSLTR